MPDPSDPEILSVRCLRDNYAWLVRHEGRTALIDAPEAAPILAALSDRDWNLDEIWLTHHHPDHIDGVAELVAETGASVAGAAADAHRLPPLDLKVAPGDDIRIAGLPGEAIDVSGHTVGHLAFYLPKACAAFTGDSLMALGCGRLFEGDAEMMWASLGRLNALPADTLICSGHDYCESNGRFALSVDPENKALKDRLEATLAGLAACAPARLSQERDTNPFLRAETLAPRIGCPDAPSAFARLRAMKDAF